MRGAPVRWVNARAAGSSRGAVACAIAFAISLPACVSFKAVEATGEVGAQLNRHTAVMGEMPRLCAAANAYAGKPADDCAKLVPEAERWGKVVAVLGAYGTKLRDLANRGELDVRAQVETVLGAASQTTWSPLESDTNGAIASFAGTVVKIASWKYRQGVLRDAIRSADAPLQGAAAALEGALELQIKNVDLVRAQTDVVGKALAATAQIAAARMSSGDAGTGGAGAVDVSRLDVSMIRTQLAGITTTLGVLDDKKRSMLGVKATVRGFREAHHRLFERIDAIDKDQLLIEVLNIVGAVRATADKLN